MLHAIIILYITSVLASCSKNLSSKVLSPGLLPAPSNKALYSCLSIDKYCVSREISDNPKHRVAERETKKTYKMLMLRNSITNRTLFKTLLTV